MTESESTEPDQSCVVAIDAPYNAFLVDHDRHEAFCRLLMESAGEENAELSVAFVDDAAIQSLNRDYRGVDAPTDVLSFSMREGEVPDMGDMLGDIVISLDTADRQARRFGHTLDDEVDELLFHGFVHLLGNDHYGQPDRRCWMEVEQRLLEALRQRHAIYLPKGFEWMEEQHEQKRPEESHGRELNSGEDRVTD